MKEILEKVASRVVAQALKRRGIQEQAKKSFRKGRSMLRDLVICESRVTLTGAIPVQW